MAEGMWEAFCGAPRGVKSASERRYAAMMSATGVCVSSSRRASGRSAGGEAYTVVSSVIRRRSHLLRYGPRSSSGSGGCSNANADSSREWTRGIWRRRNARAARLYSVCNVAAGDGGLAFMAVRLDLGTVAVGIRSRNFT
jgi:hypothetical protein